MSRVYFHTRDEGGREILGRERARVALLCSGIAAGLLPLVDVDRHLTPETARKLAFAPNASREDWVRSFLVGDEPVFQRDGAPLTNFGLVLNTALIMGNDPLCLLARLHGQCETHAYVEGPHRAWMADLIEEGYERGFCREGMGWAAVADLLRLSDTAPVVTSYSGTGAGFPNRYLTDWDAPDDEEYDETWEALSDADQWDLSMDGLRSNPDKCRDISPESLRMPFDHGASLFDLMH